jgi:hypothetical protein
MALAFSKNISKESKNKHRACLHQSKNSVVIIKVCE